MNKFDEYFTNKSYNNLKNILENIGYYKLPKLDNNKVIHYDGPVNSNPLIHYLCEINAYESHTSGNGDFEFIKKDIFDIPANRFTYIIPLTPNTFKINYVNYDFTNSNTEVINKVLFFMNYDIRIFELLGYEINTKNITMNFECT